MDIEIKSLIESISKSSDSKTLKKNHEWIKLLELISDNKEESDGKQYRIRYFIDNFLKINLDFPSLDISLISEVFSDYDSSKFDIQYNNSTSAILVKNTYDEVFNIVNSSLSSDYSYYRNLMVAILLNDKRILDIVKIDNEKLSEVFNNLNSNECFYAIYSYYILKIDIPDKYITPIYESDDSSALEVLYIIDKYYPNKIKTDKLLDLTKKSDYFNSSYFKNSIPTITKLMKNNFDLVKMIKEDNLKPSHLITVAKTLGNPECEKVFTQLLKEISIHPDESYYYYKILYAMLEIKNSPIKWDSQKLGFLKKAFEKSDQYYNHYALIYGTLVQDIKEKEFLLKKIDFNETSYLSYFLLAYANSGVFPDLILQNETVILNEECRFFYHIILAVWKKEKSTLLDFLIRKIDRQSGGDDELMDYICNTFFINLKRNPPPFAKLKRYLSQNMEYNLYSLNYLKKFSKHFTSIINSYALNNLIDDSSEYDINISDKLLDNKFSKICLLLTLTENSESARIMEGNCNSFDVINNFIVFLSRYDGKSELFEMYLKILITSNRNKLELTEKESILLSNIFFFNKSNGYNLYSILEFIKFHPSVISNIATYLFRSIPEILYRLSYPNSTDSVLRDIDIIFNSPNKLDQITNYNIIRYVDDFDDKDEIEKFLSLTVKKDKTHGITNLDNYGKVNFFERKDSFDLFMKSKEISDKLKMKFITIQILSEPMDSYNYYRYENFFKNVYNEEIHIHLLKSLLFHYKNESSISESFFKSLFYYEGSNSKYSYLSLSGENGLLSEINEWILKTQTDPNELVKRKELKKILDDYDDDTPKNYYQNIFNSRNAMKFNGRKILIQKFNFENQTHGNQLDRFTFESLFSGITIDYIDEETDSIIGKVTTNKTDELFHALFNDEDNKNKVVQCMWN
jgi:hypothetical protein